MREHWFLSKGKEKFEDLYFLDVWRHMLVPTRFYFDVVPPRISLASFLLWKAGKFDSTARRLQIPIYFCHFSSENFSERFISIVNAVRFLKTLAFAI